MKPTCPRELGLTGFYYEMNSTRNDREGPGEADLLVAGEAVVSY